MVDAHNDEPKSKNTKAKKDLPKINIDKVNQIKKEEVTSLKAAAKPKKEDDKLILK